MANNQISAQARGIVVVLQGKAWVANADGTRRLLQIGDEVQEGQKIITEDGSRLELALPNGQPLAVTSGRELLIEGSLLGTAPTDKTEAALKDLNSSTSQIERVLAGTGDISKELEPTAAGLGGGDASDSHSFVRILRINETLSTASLERGEQPESPNPINFGKSAQLLSIETPSITPSITSVEPGDVGVGDNTVDEGANLVFNVAITGTSTAPVTYALTLTGISATDGTDFNAVLSNASFTNGVTYDSVTGLVTVPAGVTDFAVTVPTLTDALSGEPIETLGLTIGGVQGVGGIKDVSTAPTITSVEHSTTGAISDNTVDEGANLVFNVAITGTSHDPVNYTLTLIGISATDGTDFNAVLSDASFTNGVTYDSVTGLVTVPAGVTDFAVTVPTLTDALSGEPIETLGLTIGGVQGVGGIKDVSTAPTITSVEPGAAGVIGDNTVDEGESLVFNVAITGTSTDPVTYALTLTGISATDGTDFNAVLSDASFTNGVTYDSVTGLVTVPAGVTDFAVTVPTLTDALSGEPIETLSLTIGGVQGVGGIKDVPGVPTITSVEPGTADPADNNVNEGSDLVFNVAINGTSSTPVTFTLSLDGISASSDADFISTLTNASFSDGVTYSAATGMITVPPGVTGFSVTVATITDGVRGEPIETFGLTIGGVQGIGGIVDNEPPVIATITTVEVGAAGVSDDNVLEGKALVYNVTLSAPTTIASTYSFVLGSGSATSGADFNATPVFSDSVTYDSASKTITVPAGVSAFTVTYSTIDDTVVDSASPETLPLSIGGVSATGGILDNDKPSITTVEVGAAGVSDDNVLEGKALVYNVTLSAPTTIASTYSFVLGSGSATSGADFNATPVFSDSVTYDSASKTITVPAGVSAFTVTYSTIDDTVVDSASPETLPLSIGGVSATGGILDNDKPSITTVEVGAAGVSDDNVLEGKALVYNVTLSAPTTIASTYSFVLGSGSATSGADFNATPVFSDSVTYDSASKTITVPAGVSAFTVTYSTIDDTVVDSASPETLPLSIGGVSATGGILDNDKPSITTVEVGAAGVSDDNVLEGKALVYNVTLSAPTTIASTYSFVLGSGSATSGADFNATPVFSDSVTYDSASKTITVPAGVSAFTVTYSTIDDTVVDSASPETLPLSIGGVSATGGILDNDKPSITTVEVGAAGVSDDNVLEGKALVYNVTLSAPTTIASTYSFVLGSGSATSGADFNATPVFSDSVTYDSASKTITVPAGVSAFTVTYSTIDDTVVDSASPETLPLSIGGVSATGGILDNDKPSITTVEVGAAGVSDDNVLEGKALVYNVTLSAPTTIASTYSFVLGSGSATSGADFNATPVFSDSVTYDSASKTITVPAGVSAFTVTYSTIDDTVVDSASPETLPLSIGGVSATGGILDNDKPSISPARTSSVSEEGLAGGITDTTGTTDTTNAVTNSGSFTVVNAASVTLSLPQGTYTSGGSPISWALSNNNHTLTGSVGGKPVMTVVINDTGGYTTTLLKPIDHPVTTAEDVRTIPITVTAANGSDTSTSTLSISVEDDAPTAANTTTSITLPNVDTNIQLILDRSSSMGDVVSGTTRFKLMKDSVNELLKAYDNLGNVRVNIVQFDANSSQLGNGWVDVATAKNLVNAMTLGNGTNYDAGINTARTAFATGGKISGAQNVTYFFSDGEPMGDGIAGNEITTWTDFLNANQINSFAYGVGTGANRTSLDPIAYNGIDHVDTLGVVVADATQLPPVLRDSSVTPTTGNLVSGSLAGSASFGADGGYLNTITIEGTTYTYDPKALNGAGQVTKVGTGKGVFDTANNTLTVTTNKDGKLVINLDTGDYSYTADPTITSTHQEVIGFSVIDRDGDGASATLRIDVNPPAQANVVTLTSSVGATLPGTGLAGEYYGYNDNRTGVASDATTKFSGVTRIHADDGNVATATLTQAATPNLSNLAEVEKIVEGRSADTSLVGSARVAPANAADAAFTIKTLEFGVASSVEVPTGANVTFNNDLGQSDVKFTTGQIVTSGAADKMNNLARFLQGNTSSIVATGGVGDTTDAAIRAVGYVNIPITGKYDFRIAGDDGYRLLINGVNLTEVDEIQAPAIATFANKTLSAGIQPIEILYWDQAGHAVLRIEVKPSGAPDAAYEVLGTKSYALFAPGSQPTGLTENQDLVETSDGVWAVRTGGVHTSNVSSQQVIGSEGNDSISTGADSDVLTGGGGNDRLTGGAGSDTFVWQLGDQGTRSHPAQDSISDFNNASQTNGGDVLNLADLLQSENHNTGIGNLGDYLHFAKSGADTIMEAKHTGAGAVTQRIVLEGLDLTQNGSLTDSAIIADLLNKGKLITD